MTLLLMLLVKSFFVFALSGAALLCLRRASASARHLVCLLTLSALLALPLFSWTLPGWQVAGLSSTNRVPAVGNVGALLAAPSAPNPLPYPAVPHSAASTEAREAASQGGAASSAPTGLERKAGHRFSWSFVCLAFYVLGVMLASLRPLIGLWGIAYLRRACASVTDAPTLSIAADCAAALRLLRLPLLCRADVSVPMTWGGRRPVIVLPSGSEGWPADRLRSVLLHEMAHVKRHDWTCHRLADLACAVYWFHPLVWLLARRLRAESEIACDDLVLSSGIAAPDYARHLLDIARALPPTSRPPHPAAIAMAQTPHIQRRILMVLDTTQRRTSPHRFLTLAAVAGVAALVPLAMLRPATKAQAAPPLSTPQTAQGKTSEAPPFNWALERQYALENGRFMRGQRFSPQEAAVQEKQTAANPNDYAAHLTLLGYYLNSTIYNKPLSAAAAAPAYRQQIFWMIRNHPESLLFSRADLGLPRRMMSAAFAKDTELWQAQIASHPSRADILGNAAEYYLLHNKALAETYLLRAQALEPQNSKWPGKLGELYRLEGEGPHPSAEVIQQSAKKALIEYEKAAMLANKTSQPSTSADLAKTAFDAGEYNKARQYADALLMRSQSKQPTGFDSSDDAHAANLVLGRLALHNGDIAGAEAHLLAMGRVSGSPVLDSFGPNMQLAQDLLERGDRQPVLAYFDECAKFWTYQPAKATLATWTAQVKQGEIPDFQGNLVY